MELPALLPNPTYPFFHGYIKLHCWGGGGGGGVPRLKHAHKIRSVYKISPGSQPTTNKPGLGKLKPMCHDVVSRPSINIHYLSSCMVMVYHLSTHHTHTK